MLAARGTTGTPARAGDRPAREPAPAGKLEVAGPSAQEPASASSQAGVGPGVAGWNPWLSPRLYRHIQGAMARCGAERCLQFGVHLYMAAEPAALRRPARRPRGLALRLAGPEALPALVAVRNEPTAKLLARFDAGHRCIAAWQENRCAAYLWAVPGPAELASQFGCRWCIPEGAVWIYDLFTVPGVVGAIAYLNETLLGAMAGRIQLVVGQVELDNRASRAAHASLGYREMGALWSWRAGQLRWHCLERFHPSRRRWLWGVAPIAPGDFLGGEREDGVLTYGTHGG